MTATAARAGLMERLRNDLVLCAEGYVFELERRGYVRSGPYVPEVVLDRPEAVEELHREFVACGSDVVLALTYYAHRDKMKVVGRERDVEMLNRQAVKLARKVALESGALVAGNISNTWVYDPTNAESSGRTVRAMYDEQLGWAKDEGIDFVVAETLDHLGEALIATDAVKALGLPAVVTLIALDDKTKDGYDFAEACHILEDRGADVVGLNCGRGPETMLAILEKIVKRVKAPVAALPVAYRTTKEQPNFLNLCCPGHKPGFPTELEPFLLTRNDMGRFAVAARDIGVKYMGVCCGGAPHYVRAMAEALGRSVPASRYSPDIARHAIFGDDTTVRDYHKTNYRDLRETRAG